MTAHWRVVRGFCAISRLPICNWKGALSSAPLCTNTLWQQGKPAFTQRPTVEFSDLLQAVDGAKRGSESELGVL